MSDHSRDLVILVTHGIDHELSFVALTIVALTIANSGLTSGLQVSIFLTSSGVDLARNRAVKLIQVHPLEPLSKLVQDFLSRGATWINNLAFMTQPSHASFADFFRAAYVNAAAASLSNDLMLVALSLFCHFNWSKFWNAHIGGLSHFDRSKIIKEEKPGVARLLDFISARVTEEG